MLKRALLIGNSKYDCMNCSDLPGVRKDIELMHRVFEQILFHEISEQNDATEACIDEAIKTFLYYKNPNQDDINVIYYSGHGITKDSELNIVTPLKFTENGFYSINRIIKHFDSNPSHLIIILDMCRSDGIDRIPSPCGNNLTVIYATGAGTESHARKHGLSYFTECIAEKMTLVNASISTIVASTNREMGNHSQVPAIYQSDDKDMVLNPLSLDMEWFRNQTSTAIKHLGKRYCPEVNVSVGLDNTFDALCFEDGFKNDIKEKLDEKLTDCDKSIHKLKREKDKALLQIKKDLPEKIDHLRSMIFEFINKLAIENISESNANIVTINSTCDDIIQYCEQIDNDDSLINTDIYKEIHSVISNVTYYIVEIRDIITSKRIQIALKPCIYLHGSGGIGKTHSIAHLVYSRTMCDKPSIMLVGGSFFSENDPDVQIMHDLNLDCSFIVLLDHLNNLGKRHNNRILICIDALNEGQGKDIWKNKLNYIVDNVSCYPWLALLVSSRSYFYDNLVASDSVANKNIIPITHPGFTRVGFESIIKYFEYYKINWQPSLLMISEFSNPLFLRLFCEGYAEQMIPERNLSADMVFTKYINTINRRIADECEYNEHIPAVNDFLISVQEIKYKYIKENVRERKAIQQLKEKEYIESVRNVQRDYGITKDFLSALFHEDILTNVYNGKESFAITYERIEDYYLASIIYQKYREEGTLDEAIVEYLLYNNELLREFICCLANNKIEIDDVIKINEDNKMQISKAFIESLLWRKGTSITQSTYEIINEWVIPDSQMEYDFWNTIVSLAPCLDHPLNGNTTYNYMMKFSMADRDAHFIPVWDILLDRNNSLAIMLMKWMQNKTIQEKAGIEEIICVCKCICWFLISSNHKVRDMVTEAIQNSLMYHMDMVPALLDAIIKIDDPYVLERVLAAVYGSLLIQNQKTNDIKMIGDWIYKNIYSQRPVITNIMIRDYASGIIEYMQKHFDDYKECTVDLRNKIIGDIRVPDDSEIDQYKEQLGPLIMHSMRVEYDRQGRPGGYGDFGRYTFQSYFSKWNIKKDYCDLMNIALQNIKSRGYDVKKHGDYDRMCRFDRSGPNARERIGKKYQWLALYELAGEIIDHYPVDKYVDKEDREEVYHGMRNYDPTVIISENEKKEERNIHNKLYEIDNQLEVEKWLFTYEDIRMDDMKRFIELRQDTKQYVVIKGHYNWAPKHVFGKDSTSGESQHMYLIVNMYYVRKSEFDDTISTLKNQDFMGRWMPEREYDNGYFLRERYWSDIYKINEGEIWQTPDRGLQNVNVMVPYISYSGEGKDDRSKVRELRYYLPCYKLVDECKLDRSIGNSILADSYGNVISFDSSEYLNESIGMYMEIEAIKQYANKNDLIPIWTVLCEKTFTGLNYMDRKTKIPGHISGVYYLAENGEIEGECKVIER